MQTRLFGNWIFAVRLDYIIIIPTAAVRIVRDALSNFSFAQISYTPFSFEGQDSK